MTRDEIQALLRGLLEQLTDDDEIARLEFKERGKPVYGHWSDMEDHDGEVRPVEASAIQRDIQFWRDILDEGDFSAVDETVDELLQGREVDPATRRRFAVGVIETFIKGKEVSLGRTMGNGFTVLEVPPGPLVPTPPLVPRTAVEGAPVTPAKPLASALVAPFAQHRLSRGVAQRDVNKEQTHLRRFFEVNGDRAVDQYGRGDVTKWLDTLRRLPKHNGRSAIQRAAQPSLNELIEQADAADAPRLGEKTVENNLATLRAFLDFAVDAELLTRTQRNDIVDGHKFRDAHADNEQRDQWQPDELKRLFSSPVWAGCAGGNRWSSPGDHIPRNSAQFWLPLLALYHGARLEEFSDLYRKDVACIDGTWAFSIVPSVIEEVAEDGTMRVRKRKLKTRNAKRIMPLHPEIIRFGFLQHVEDTAPNQNDPLFPDLPPQPPDGRRGPRFTRWFTNYRKRIGVYREGVGMHAFRHTANTRLRDALGGGDGFQRERHVAYLLGHAQGGGEGRERYDKGPGLKAVADTLALLGYPEIDLSHLYSVEEVHRCRN